MNESKTTNRATIKLTQRQKDDILAVFPAHVLKHGKGEEFGRVVRPLVDAAWALFQECEFDPARVEAKIRPILAGRKKGNQGH